MSDTRPLTQRRPEFNDFPFYQWQLVNVIQDLVKNIDAGHFDTYVFPEDSDEYQSAAVALLLAKEVLRKCHWEPVRK